MTTISVAELWRYPVKSMRGEPLETADVAADGIAGDRLVHVREAGGRVVTSRYRPGLLGLHATLGLRDEPLIDGVSWSSPDALTAVRRVTFPDANLVRFVEPDRGQRYDVLPLMVMTDGMAAAIGVDYRRFRPNILLAGVPGLEERTWVGMALRVSDVLIGVRRPRPRCVMTTFDPDTLEQDPTVLKRIVRDFDGQIALDCWVIEPGVIQVGDEVRVVDLPAGIALPVGNATR